jgi:alpha-tubulin suppressor-like RCC1 family protein
MPETEHIEFVQIAAAKDHLYGMTRSGAVWRYDDDRRLWEALSMSLSAALKKPAFEAHEQSTREDRS